MTRPLIVLTNDDGILSPGLAAAAVELQELGDLLIVAPESQQTSMARSRTSRATLDGRIEETTVQVGDVILPGYAVRAVPAIVVDIAVQEIASRPVDLVVSGINYGENIGSCVTTSGTVGAALEAADIGIPGLAVSLEVDAMQYFEHDPNIDFRTAAYFTKYFAGRMLGKTLLPDVDILKVDVPADATPNTGWVVTSLDKMNYYLPKVKVRADRFTGKATIETKVAKGEYSRDGSDAHALARGLVSVTPLSLDLTSRIKLENLEDWIKS